MPMTCPLSRAQELPVPHTDIRHAADERIFIEEISPDHDEQLRVGVCSGYDFSIELSCHRKYRGSALNKMSSPPFLSADMSFPVAGSLTKLET